MGMGISWRLLLAGLLAWSLPAGAVEPLQVTVVSTDFTLPGKARKLDRWARGHGVRVEYVSIDRPPPGGPEQWFADTGLVVIDTPVSSHAERVRGLLGPTLAESGMPWIAVGGGATAFGGDRLDERQARLLAEYYRHGGETNFRRMLDWLGRWHRNESTSEVPAPWPMPSSGYYHPEAKLPFESLEAYLAWQRARGHAERPRVALVISSHALSSMQLKDVDALIAASEARGLSPVTYWFDRRAPDGLIDGLRGAGISALVNMTHLGDGDQRLRDFTQLDVPALIATTSRGNTVAQWRENASGMGASAMAVLLAVPESWGMSDPVVLAAVEDGEPVPIPEQVAMLADKLAALVRLRDVGNPDKRLALMFWNYPHGEHNLSASHLNLPRSVASVTAALVAEGYRVDAVSEQQVIDAGQAMLGGWYRPETLPELVRRDLAATLPLADYRQWLHSLPPRQRQSLLERWGDPADSRAVAMIDGARAFVIPRWRIGELVALPQPPRSDAYGEAVHDGAVPPTHAYLAAYLWLRRQHDPHALIHFGTHGTQEWLPGKDRGLWAYDWPNLAIGDLPVVYPYIQDNIGEAMQAKRRGRAVLVSHQTPAFAPAGLYDEMRDLHEILHEYHMADQGPVREAARRRLREAAIGQSLHSDIGWSEQALDADFDGFLGDLHDHLHQLARSSIPLGLHVFGAPAEPEHRLTTVLQQMDDGFHGALGVDPDEAFADDHSKIRDSRPYRFLHRYLHGDGKVDDIADPVLRHGVERARVNERRLASTGEMEALLSALRGGFVRPGEGGDPVRNPEVPSGRNLYAFDPEKIPVRSAWEAGEQALEQLIAAHRESHDGQAPDKLTFVMWSVETVRHLGVIEAQVLHAAGLRPVWDEAGKVERLEVVPREQLGRPRIDVVVQVTGSYRDQFDGFMRKLDAALQRLSGLDEPGNAIAANSRRIAASLTAGGVPASRAAALSRLRMFGNAPGDYGTDLADRVLDSTSWDSEAPLADQFLDRLQYGYGGDDWGVAGEHGNLLAQQLSGTDGVVLPRSSNLYGVLNTDHVFEYMGGLSMAMRRIDGATPTLYVNDLRSSVPRTTTAAEFLSAELRSRYLNPQWIEEMKQEGYAGTLQALDVTNNLFGWQVTDPSSVRADQWQALHRTYVLDSRGLGVNEWFERHNPTAQMQLVERMMEAVRKGYWDADARTRGELAARWQELASRHGGEGIKRATREFMEEAVSGFGLDSAVSVPAAEAITEAVAEAATEAAAAPAGAEAATAVRGQVMEEVEPPRFEWPWPAWLGALLLMVSFVSGGWRQAAGPFPHRSIA